MLSVVSNRPDLLEAARVHQNMTGVRHVSFSPYGGWVILFEDDTILLSNLGRFPNSFNTLIAPHVNLSAARVSRQRSKVKLVFFGAYESVVIQTTDKLLSDRISPELAAVLKEIP